MKEPMRFLCRFYFHGTLTDFLQPAERERWITHPVQRTASAKDTIEAIGVPHVEIAIIIVNGREAPLNKPLKPDDEVEVFPYSNQLSEAAPWSFVLDVHLGKLARLLRLFGINSAYRNNLSDPEIVALAVAEGRAVPTRDIGLLKHKVLTYGYWLRSQHPEERKPPSNPLCFR